MFNLESFVEDCRAAVQDDPTHRAVAEVMRRAFADPAAITAGLGGAPSKGGIDCTIADVPRYVVPHTIHRVMSGAQSAAP